MILRTGARPVVSRSDPAGFAGWQSGRLNYTSAPLEAVASDLSRALGSQVRVDARIRSLPFTGSIRIEGDHDATITNFAATIVELLAPTDDRPSASVIELRGRSARANG